MRQFRFSTRSLMLGIAAVAAALWILRSAAVLFGMILLASWVVLCIWSIDRIIAGKPEGPSWMLLIL